MKIAIIGSTGHVGYVLNGLRELPEAQLLGIAPGSADEPMERFQQACQEDGHQPRLFESAIAMLDEVKPDVLAIACSFNDHCRWTLEAIKRGIAVFVEKPMATTLEDLDKLEHAYRQFPVHLASMFGIRFTPWFLTAKQLIDDGAIGDIRLMNAQKSYKLGQRSAWYKNRETYGGTIPWVGSHAIDWIHWFSGAPFQSVFAAHSTFANQDHGELEATALAQFTCSNEIFASVTVDYLRPAVATSHDDDRIRVVGTKGIVEVCDQQVWLHNADYPVPEAMPLVDKQESFTDFVLQVQGVRPGIVTAEQSFDVTRACLLARQSADEHKQLLFPVRSH